MNIQDKGSLGSYSAKWNRVKVGLYTWDVKQNLGPSDVIAIICHNDCLSSALNKKHLKKTFSALTLIYLLLFPSKIKSGKKDKNG